MKGLAIGSCFVENIGGWLLKVKFNLQTNPFGITYNPISISKQLTLLSNMETYPEAQLFLHNEFWQSFDHHSRFSGMNKNTVLSTINKSFLAAKTQLNNVNYLLITFGTANIYTHKKSNQVVSNCHKLPNNEFSKKRLTVKEIMAAWEPILQKFSDMPPLVNIIFTVSPVRHLRDGILENQRSKATLLLAIDNLVTKFDNCHYFPAYEIVIDDLRDYRFYDKDMIHPNEVAIDYIKEKFAATYFDENCKSIVDEIVAVQNAVGHKAFWPESEGHKAFVRQTLEKIEGLVDKYGFDFEEEVESLCLE